MYVCVCVCVCVVCRTLWILCYRRQVCHDKALNSRDPLRLHVKQPPIKKV